MECNREDAEKLVERAKRLIVKRELETARRLLQRAQNMYPTERARGIVAIFSQTKRIDRIKSF